MIVRTIASLHVPHLLTASLTFDATPRSGMDAWRDSARHLRIGRLEACLASDPILPGLKRLAAVAASWVAGAVRYALWRYGGAYAAEVAAAHRCAA